MENPKGYRPLRSHQYNSFSKILLICINVCLSSFFLGYAIVYIGALPDFTFIMEYYFIGSPSTKQLTQSLVQGCVPIGSILGALSATKIIKKFSRRNGFLVTNFFGTISLLLLFIRSPFTLVIGRLIQGMCTGIFVAIVPVYINQIVTPDLRILGTMNQIFIAVGQGFCYIFYYFLTKVTASEEVRWLWVAECLLILIVLQTLVFLFVFPYETPKYLFEKNNLQKASSLLNLIYNSDYIEEAISEYRTGTMIEDVSLRNSEINLEETENRIYVTSSLAIFIALYISFSKQMTGINAINVYGKQALKPILSHQFYQILPAIVAFMPAVTAVIATVLLKKIGRRTLLVFGYFMYCIILAVIAVGFFVHNPQSNVASSVIISIGLLLHTSMMGLTLGAITYLYIPQMVEPKIVPYSSMFNLTGVALCVMAFPLLKKVLPNEGYLFMIFLGWCFVAFLVTYKYVVQTKGRPRMEVFEDYEKKKIC